MTRVESRIDHSVSGAACASASASVGRHDRRTVVRLCGEHDVATAAMVSAALGRATNVDDADVVVDLSQVGFMSAATIGNILRVRRILKGRGRALVLQAPSPAAHRLLDLCRLNGLVEVAPTSRTAVSGPAGALATWVEVPVRDSVEASGPDTHVPPVPAQHHDQVVDSDPTLDRFLAAIRRIDPLDDLLGDRLEST